MKTLSHKEFERRWQTAGKTQTTTLRPAAIKHDVTLSLCTILDNYLAQLDKAVQAHALDKDECDCLRDKVAELKPLARDIEKKAAPYLRIRD